ncbi:MAG: polysaccharide biosynthesis/export family protein [Ferruginibacter sp.]
MPYQNYCKIILGFCGILICTSFLFSCKISQSITEKEYLYFQNGLDSIRNVKESEPVIHENDLLSIQISSSSLNQDQTVPFNPPGNAGYLVRTDGNIEMPVIGMVKAAGLTQVQLQNLLIEKLSSYVKDPNAIIHFLQFKINVLGEVKSPGVQKFDVDRVTILDAIGAAGDLTETGKREDITVIREENNKRRLYKVDIRSGSLFQSPVYNLQSNDIVYVGANFQKFKSLKSNNNTTTLRALQVFSTVLGLFTTILYTINYLNK